MKNKFAATSHKQFILIAILIVLAAVISACSSDTEAGENQEESGTELALSERYDQVRNGARLILSYNAQSNSFNGTVENTTDNILKGVRVEVHLSNGVELGPTIPTDLNPGEIMDITLKATSRGFDGWTAHPEVGEGGGGEHGRGEGEGGHGGEGGSGDNGGGSN
ncbi:MAG: hypothetical protein KAT29_02315 [Anaerolineales bacterium]|nr:hypothetical protein [Anaerolineales bacterium]